MKLINAISNQLFWVNWILLHTIGIPMLYLIGFLPAYVMGAWLGYDLTQWDSPWFDSALQLATETFMGLGIGIIQWQMLRKIIHIHKRWIFTVALGFILSELLVGYLLISTGQSRADFRFLEQNTISETLIFLFAGLVTGLIQYSVLRLRFRKSGMWVWVSCLAWGLAILPTQVNIYAIFGGAMLYGIITSAAMIHIIHKPH